MCCGLPSNGMLYGLSTCPDDYVGYVSTPAMHASKLPPLHLSSHAMHCMHRPCTHTMPGHPAKQHCTPCPLQAHPVQQPWAKVLVEQLGSFFTQLDTASAWARAWLKACTQTSGSRYSKRQANVHCIAVSLQCMQRGLYALCHYRAQA